MDNKIKLHLRPATLDDAKILFDWRNDSETRKHSGNQKEISWNEHLSWFNSKPDSRLIYIAEVNGIPVGTIRANENELSWTVAPEARGQNLGKAIVLQFVQEIFKEKNPFAVIEEGHIPSENIAKALGLKPAEKATENSRTFVTWR